jgi:hypothetical protein
VIKQLNRKNWSSLTGVVGHVERTFSDVVVHDFNGWCAVIKIGTGKYVFMLNSQNEKGNQVLVRGTKSRKKVLTCSDVDMFNVEVGDEK